MPKFYATGRPRKYAKVYRRKRFASKVSRVKYSISPRAMHMPLPSRMCVTLRAVDNNYVTYTSVVSTDGFLYPLYFPGLYKDNTGIPAFAGGFLQLMQLYSQAVVKRVAMKTRMMAINNASNVNLNIYTMITSENNADQVATDTTLASFQDNSNTWLARKHYLSVSTGGHPYSVDYRTCDVQKFNHMVNSNQNLIFNSTGNQFTTPSVGEARNYPCYIVVARNPLGIANAEVAYEMVFDFDIEFTGLKNLSQQISGLTTPSWTRRS